MIAASLVLATVMLKFWLLLSEPSLLRTAISASREFERISPETLHEEFQAIVAGSVEEGETAAGTPAAADAAPGAPLGATQSPSLDQFTIDLTALARSGGIDPIVGSVEPIRFSCYEPL